MDISETIHLLGDLLGQAIGMLESPQAFETEEHIRKLAKDRRAGVSGANQALVEEIRRLETWAAWPLASAFTLYFDLVNLAEEQSRLQALRQQARSRYPEPVDDSIAAALKLMKTAGVPAETIQQLIEKLDIEIVLTAHPTEAKRRTILSKAQRINAILQRLNEANPLPGELEEAKRQLLAEISAAWLTERVRTVQPAVTDEVRTGLFYVDSVFWEVIPQVWAALEAALARYYPGTRLVKPWLRVASWMGGDRDGNPNVTAEVTAETLRLHRGLAVEKHRAAFQELARRMSLSAKHVPVPPALAAWIEGRRPFPPHVQYIEDRYGQEPFRLALSLVAADLAEASQDSMREHLLSRQPHQARLHPEDLVRPLELIAAAVPEAIAQDDLLTLHRQVEAFGLHAARLDLREDAAKLNRALGEILRALRIEPEFDTAPPQARLEALKHLLSAPAPELSPTPGVTPPTAETWAVFQLMARTREVYGQELLGPFIISMASSAADILTVLLLARWTGCSDCLFIAPLFETISDLEAAPRILEELFSLEIYQKHLASCQNEQIIMIGYSDSNKDGGYLMANWMLYQAQERVARLCQERGVKLTLFHWRGGTVARGGGPANRAIRAQPPGTVNGRLRLTEQGEVISSRYLSHALALRQLEQLVNAVLLASVPLEASAPSPDGDIPAEWREALNRMAQASHQAYRALVYETPGFIEFWQAVTPLDEIKRLHIGSRPAARSSGKGEAEAIQKIRAIPWVFSWMQNRCNLPGWFGLGTGLETAPEAALLRHMYQGWPFFRAIIDNAEMSLLKADMEIAAQYMELMPDQDLAKQIFDQIRAEYERTKALILQTNQNQALMEGEPVIQRSIQLRNPYVDPLNYLQVEMLRRLRALDNPEGEQAQAIRDVIVVSINGIAAGLRNTG